MCKNAHARTTNTLVAALPYIRMQFINLDSEIDKNAEILPPSRDINTIQSANSSTSATPVYNTSKLYRSLQHKTWALKYLTLFIAYTSPQNGEDNDFAFLLPTFSCSLAIFGEIIAM